MSIHIVLNDHLMFYDKIIKFLWIEDIQTLYSLSSRFYSVMKSLEEKVKITMTLENFIEDYWNHIESIRNSIEKKKDFKLGWTNFNLSMKYTKDLYSGKLENEELRICIPYRTLSCIKNDGKCDGKCLRWYVNGQKWEECFYKDGNLEGKREMWYENGQIWEECFYKNEKLEGRYLCLYEIGQKWVDCLYKDGII